MDHDCASSNPGFRAAIANSYIRVLSPLHSASVPVQCQRAAQPSHHSGHGWLEVVKKPSAIHPPVKNSKNNDPMIPSQVENILDLGYLGVKRLSENWFIFVEF